MHFRVIGSSAALAIATSVFNTYTRPILQALTSNSESNLLVGSLASLPQGLQEEVRDALAEGYSRQILVLCVSTALQIPAALPL